MTAMVGAEELLAVILPRLRGVRGPGATWRLRAGRKDTSRKTAAEIPRRASGGSREGDQG